MAEGDSGFSYENLEEYRGKNKNCAYCGREFIFTDMISLVLDGPPEIKDKLFCFRIEDYKETLKDALKAGSCLYHYVADQGIVSKFLFKSRKFIGDVDPDYNL